MSDQEREQLSEDVSEDEEMSAEPAEADEADEAEQEEEPPKFRPLSGY